MEQEFYLMDRVRFENLGMGYVTEVVLDNDGELRFYVVLLDDGRELECGPHQMEKV